MCRGIDERDWWVGQTPVMFVGRSDTRLAHGLPSMVESDWAAAYDLSR